MRELIEPLIKLISELTIGSYDRLSKDLKRDPINTIYTIIFLLLIGFTLTYCGLKIYAEFSKKEVHFIIEPNTTNE